ncbi:MAG: TA system VapC family ribonuclease toxin [Bryobacterales bacterium]
MKKGTSKFSQPLLLLDVNVLIALAWPNHQFHRSATARLEPAQVRWATCCLTELGFIRLSSDPRIVGKSVTPMQAAMLLQAMVSDERHLFLDTLGSPTQPPFLPVFERILGPKQVTDLYLLSLAANHKAHFLTFDARLNAVNGEHHTVEVLTA